ncbi:MAG: hypothetical protein ACYS9Y_14575 [Planctomycetota bacterium]|jgi:hypothetical protein
MNIIAVVIAGLALIFSIVSFFISFGQQHKFSIATHRLQDSIFHMERNTAFEGKLADWQDAFKLHGIDLQAARTKGVTPEQITYLIMSINAMNAYCSARNITVKKHLVKNEYRRRMFSCPETRRTWEFARRCSIKSTRCVIDSYLSQNYSETYERL